MTLTKADLMEMTDVVMQVMTERFGGVENSLDGMKSKLGEIDARLDVVDARLDKMGAGLDKVDTRLDKVDTRLDKVDTRLDKMGARLDEMDTRLDKMDTRLDKMDTRIDGMEEILFNDVVPRLQNIEACYLSTYNRYVEKNKKIDQIEMDVSVLKKIVHEHALILDKIS